MHKNKFSKQKSNWRRPLVVLVAVIVVIGIGFSVYNYLLKPPTIEEVIERQLTFDDTVSEQEKVVISDAIKSKNIELTGDAVASVVTSEKTTNGSLVIGTYVPVTNVYSVRQKLLKADLTIANTILYADEIVGEALAATLGLVSDTAKVVSDEVIEPSETETAFISVEKLDATMKLLNFEGNYYLDSFESGAIFREVRFEGESAAVLSELNLNESLNKDKVYKTNITGVTALTRIMMRKLSQVNDPLYFSAKIGDFLADADLTHVSNEVSFIPGCTYSDTSFCSPPEFIETLKASGVDLVELTGNHNNDQGSIYNTETINLYKSLGWETIGGGLNNEEAAKPFMSDTKGSNISFLAYNYPDSPNGGAISGVDSAGANSFDFDRIATEITTAKETSDFVMVNVQYWECYAYPDGYVEFPICDAPVGDQEEVFKKLIDLGADMVVGSSAHQPQTYEMYNGKPIYYGLGNLYFDQTQWPGTERGIILTNYFADGELLQTKLTPTVFDRDLQTRVSTDEEAEYLLTRLHDAR